MGVFIHTKYFFLIGNSAHLKAIFSNLFHFNTEGVFHSLTPKFSVINVCITCVALNFKLSGRKLRKCVHCSVQCGPRLQLVYPNIEINWYPLENTWYARQCKEHQCTKQALACIYLNVWLVRKLLLLFFIIFSVFQWHVKISSPSFHQRLSCRKERDHGLHFPNCGIHYPGTCCLLLIYLAGYVRNYVN